jgi:hypothetical protein
VYIFIFITAAAYSAHADSLLETLVASDRTTAANHVEATRVANTMIHIRFRNNLGNQMFQYTAARLAAERLDCPLVISQDVFVWRDVLRGRQTRALFRVFPTLPGGLAGRWVDLCERYFPQITARLLRALFATEFNPWSPRCAPSEGLEGYHPGYLQLKKFTRLKGHFQSPLYMRGHEAAVRGWFRMSGDESADIERRWAKIGIDPAEAVAVHIRLGDYRHQLPIGSSVEGGWLLPRRYYHEALEMLGGSRQIALFSDEPDLAEEFLGRKADYVSRMDDIKLDFRMLSSCARMIIANSTFSWWAAWLNPNASPLIVAPEFFLGRNVGTWYPKDIRVDGWHYI